VLTYSKKSGLAIGAGTAPNTPPSGQGDVCTVTLCAALDYVLIAYKGDDDITRIARSAVRRVWPARATDARPATRSKDDPRPGKRRRTTTEPPASRGAPRSFCPAGVLSSRPASRKMCYKKRPMDVRRGPETGRAAERNTTANKGNKSR